MENRLQGERTKPMAFNPTATPSDLTPDSFPIDTALLKRCRSAAAVHLGLSLYYVTVLIVLFARSLGHDDSFPKDLADRSGSILILLGFVAVNLFLAACVGHVLKMYRWASWLVVLAVVSAAGCFFGVLTLSILAWIQPDSTSTGAWTVLASALQGGAYAYCTWQVAGAVARLARERKQALREAMGPVPTASL